jgi:hypothetical protein
MMALSIFLAIAFSAQAPATGDSYVGRWNVIITDATDTFVSGGIQIDKTPTGLAGGLVWRSGSFAPVQSVEVVDGALKIVRSAGENKLDVFEARLDGGVLKGKVTYASGRTNQFEGRKAPPLPSFKTSAGWKTTKLFDGKTLDGWHQRNPKAKNGWAVVDGELAVVDPKGNSDLVSDATFQDMQLHLEFNIEPKSNSGVYLRGRYEIQLLDNPDAKMALDTHGCGAVYSRLAPTIDATRPAGEWQTLDVEFIGRDIEVKLNGKTVVKGVVEGITGGALSPWEGEPGPLMLQGDHGKVRFRNIEVKSR